MQEAVELAHLYEKTERNVFNYAMDSNATEPHTAAVMSYTTHVSLTLASIRTLDQDRFVDRLGPLVEHSPWVARRAWARGPFDSRHALFEALRVEIHGASDAEQLALLRVHPELAGQEARAGSMTADSQSEQGRLGLLRLDESTVRRIEDHNRRYRERFGFPFVVALRLHASLDSVLADGEHRLHHDALTERRTALEQVCEVMRGRLERTVTDDPSPHPSPDTSFNHAGSPS
jgi:2-oxo-4-hydroxy-4-carboxy-5-ureidoimidazoline decarboxylase